MFSDLYTHRPSPGFALWHSPAKTHKTNFNITCSQHIKMPRLRKHIFLSRSRSRSLSLSLSVCSLPPGFCLLSFVTYISFLVSGFHLKNCWGLVQLEKYKGLRCNQLHYLNCLRRFLIVKIAKTDWRSFYFPQMVNLPCGQGRKINNTSSKTGVPFFFLIPFAYSMKDTSRQQNNLSNAKYCVHVFNQGSLDREQISFLLENKALWICGLRQES